MSAPAAQPLLEPTEAAAPEAAVVPDAVPAATLAPRLTRLLVTTECAFCFSMREGMLLLAGIQLLTVAFLTRSLSFLGFMQGPADGRVLWAFSCAMMLLNAGLGVAAVRGSSERAALALVASFGALVVMMAVDVSIVHPTSCTDDSGAIDTPLGARRALAHCLPCAHSLRG